MTEGWANRIGYHVVVLASAALLTACGGGSGADVEAPTPSSDATFGIQHVAFADGQVTFDIGVLAKPIENFDLLIRFSTQEVRFEAVSVQGPSEGWFTLPQVTAGEIKVSAFTMNESPLVAGQAALSVAMPLLDVGDRSVTVTVSGTFGANETAIPAFTRVLTP